MYIIHVTQYNIPEKRKYTGFFAGRTPQLHSKMSITIPFIPLMSWHSLSADREEDTHHGAANTVTDFPRCLRRKS